MTLDLEDILFGMLGPMVVDGPIVQIRKPSHLILKRLLCQHQFFGDTTWLMGCRYLSIG